MYLTKLNIDKNLLRKVKIDDKYQAHQLVYSFFPQRKNDRILFRINEDHILIQSIIPPDLSSFHDFEFSLKQLNKTFDDGVVLKFDIIINPTRKTRENKNRIGIVDEKERESWFSYQANKFGYEVLYLEDFGYEMKKIKKQDCNFTVIENRLCGVLKVVDSDKFNDLFRKGLGSGKSLGYGMFCVAPCESI